ncbi:hypothetical protein V8C86DRAFT_3034873 [Haematococcus lacustris]
MQKLESSKRAKRGGWAMWAGEEEATGFQGTSSPALLHTRAQVQGVQARRRVQVGARIEENGSNTIVIATPMWLSCTQQVAVVHMVIGSNANCKGVIAKQLIDVMGLNPSSTNRRLLQLKDQGLGYKQWPLLSAVGWLIGVTIVRLPTSLPSEKVVEQSLPKAHRDRLLSGPRARYPDLKLTSCLKVELDALQLLATRPEADVLRSKMGWLGPLSPVTWKSYVHDHVTFLLYLAFLKMRGDSSVSEARKHLQLACSVSMWLALTNPTQPWSSWVQRQLVPHYTSLNQALSKLGTHRRAVLQTQALVNPVEQPRAEALLQWQEQFKDNALQQLSKYQAWEALPVEVAHLLCGEDGQQLVQTLYLNSQGLPYSVENLAKWWKRLHTVSKATWSFVPLHELRNVFITHRLDHPEVPGPSTEASAHVMLNSPTTWHAHYDRNKKQRLALEAQANMPLYRQALLQGGVGKSRGPDQQKSRGEEGGAGSDDEA